MTAVTVITAVRNGMPYLPAAVESVLSQTVQELRYIIIDDGSADETIEYLASVRDRRVEVLRQDAGGKATAINSALPHVETPYWAIQDADDLAHPDRIRRQIAALDSDPDLGLVYSGWQFLTKRGTWGATWSGVSKARCAIDVQRLRPPGHDATMAFRTSATAGLALATELTVGQGIDFGFQVGERASVAVVEGCLLTYRVHPRSNTARNVERIDAAHRLIIARAASRRGLIVNDGSVQGTNRRRRPHRRLSSDLVPHTIESVLDHRGAKDPRAGFTTAVECALHNPWSIYQYKPFPYAIAPIAAIAWYRAFRD